jgi:hypothetical protein
MPDLVSDLGQILKTAAVADNSSFTSDSWTTATHLIHCEGNFRFIPKHGIFLLPATAPVIFNGPSGGVCRHHRAMSKFQTRASETHNRCSFLRVHGVMANGGVHLSGRFSFGTLVRISINFGVAYLRIIHYKLVQKCNLLCFLSTK